MIFKLKKNQFDYLGYSLSEEQEIVRWKLKEVNKENQFVLIEIDKERADAIRDWAMDKQVHLGFDMNYELTSEGKILEELIDLFYTG